MKNDTSLIKYLAFLKTVETGSFTKAGKDLNYSQGNISLMIKDLEDEWGVKLLKRDRAGVLLTSDGTRLLPIIKDICNGYNSLRQQIDDLKELDTGLIKIGTYGSVATNYLPEFIKKFKEKYPNIEFQLLCDNSKKIEDWVENGNVDFGILSLPTKKDFQSDYLFQEELKLVLPKGHPLNKKEEVSLSDLTDEDFVLIGINGKSEITELFDQYGFKPKVSSITWSNYSVLSMVEQNLGISFSEELILKRNPFAIEVRNIKETVSKDIGLIYKDKTYQSKAVRTFIDFLKENND